jgi:predicted nucleic acid-binding protein
MTEELVVDSFALVCLFNKEPGWEIVQRAFYERQRAGGKALLNWINWGEFYYVLRRRVGPHRADETMQLLEQLPVQMVEVDPLLVRSAAEIKSDHPVSFADAFCIATALRHRAAVLTSDPEFKAVEHLIEIRWIRKKV